MKKRFDSIRDFVNFLDQIGEVKHIREKVSPIIEISKFTDVESKKPDGGKALLFENVVDNGEKTFPVATNIFGSERRMALALGLEKLSGAGAEIGQLLNQQPPTSFADKIRAFFKLLPLAKIMPETVKDAPCQEVVMTGQDVDLGKIPILKCWPGDGGRFITLPLVFTKSPVDGKTNLGMYRMQVYDKNTTGMHWHIHKDGAHYFHEYARAGIQKMPFAVAIGADPSVIYAATAPLPRGVDELLLAGFFRKEGVKMVKCKTVDLQVPAESEFVLEGYVDKDELRLEGPFGDHTGYYSMPDMYPVFHVTAITRKRQPLYCATLVGPPPMEDCYMAKATERIFLPMLKSVFPEIEDYFLPWEGVFHNIVIVSIDKEYPAQAQKLMSGLWGQGQMSFCKAIVVVDKNVRPSDLQKIGELFATSFDPERDITYSYGVLDVLDHSAPQPFAGSKIGIDLTAPIAGESPRKGQKLATPTQVQLSEMEAWILENVEAVEAVELHRHFGAVSIDKGQRKGRDILLQIANCPGIKSCMRAVAIFDTDVDIAQTPKIMWKIFNNTDPKRDILIDEQTLFIDACRKNSADGYTRPWPEELRFDK